LFLFEKICCEFSEEGGTFTGEECGGFSIFGDDAGVCVFEGGEEVAFGKDSALSAFSHAYAKMNTFESHLASFSNNLKWKKREKSHKQHT
jgi:hypothetical protein